jgi:peptidoglycan LD-endopeptidase LytH
MVSIVRFLLWILVLAILIAGIAALVSGRSGAAITGVRSPARDLQVLEWIQRPADHPDWAVKSGKRCGQAPFLMPTSGYIGYLWDDSFRPGHRHQGIDIFGGSQPGEIPVFAAADGYLTREADWKSSLIIRIPSDPLKSDRQIWIYYTHMAYPDGRSLISADFPPGTNEVFIQAGTFLGNQGNFSGTPGAPVGVHLHFSIVKDNDQGRFKNELHIENTIDPSPYLGLTLNAHFNNNEIPRCTSKSGEDLP